MLFSGVPDEISRRPVTNEDGLLEMTIPILLSTPSRDRVPLSCEGVGLPNHRRIAALLALLFLLFPVPHAQAQNIFQMSPEERAAYFAKINKES